MVKKAKKQAIWISIILLFIVIISTLLILNPQEQSLVRVKDNLQDCQERRNDALQEGYSCEIPCQKMSTSMLDCVIRNTNSYDLDQNEFSEESYATLNSDYYVICWKENDLSNVSAGESYTEAKLFSSCYANPNFDWEGNTISTCDKSTHICNKEMVYNECGEFVQDCRLTKQWCLGGVCVGNCGDGVCHHEHLEFCGNCPEDCSCTSGVCLDNACRSGKQVIEKYWVSILILIVILALCIFLSTMLIKKIKKG